MEIIILKKVVYFTASPVPFKDQLTIKYDFDYQSDVKIEVFNAREIKSFQKQIQIVI
jgi:hypothetical protein